MWDAAGRIGQQQRELDRDRREADREHRRAAPRIGPHARQGHARGAEHDGPPDPADRLRPILAVANVDRVTHAEGGERE